MLAAGCGSARVGGPRFANEPIVWTVDDRRDVPNKPAELEYFSDAYAFRQHLIMPLTHGLSIPDVLPAKNVNALGEVPNSTWFHNRIGRGLITPQDVAAGPGRHPVPSKDGPWTILESKPAGASPGFLIEDPRGDIYMVKFDVPDFPEIETAAEVIGQRIFWALGYHVPQSEIDEVDRDQFAIGDGATYIGRKREEVPMTEAFVDLQFAGGNRSADGSYRVHVTKFLSGEPLGGYPDWGVRRDDPNDLVPHQDRRELRAHGVFFNWLAHTDIKPDNRLDMWVEDPDDPERHFVMHYLLDFGKALGSFATTVPDPSDTYTYRWDYAYFFGSLFALGMWPRPWERWDARPHPSIGRFDVEHYDPSSFRTRHPYRPIWAMQPADALWAVKTMLALTPEHLRAAVQQGRYSDEAAEDLMVEILIERRRKAARHFLGEVLPLGDFELRRRDGDWALCTTDLWIEHRLGGEAPFDHRASVHDWWGRPLRVARPVAVAADGRVCALRLPLAEEREGYTIVGWFGRRAGEDLAPVWVHLARNPETDRPRIIGVWRD